MKVTNWEFKNRATIFGLIFGLAFSAYFIDPQNSAAALANWIEAARGIDANLVARLLFAFATCLLVVAALFRTWASSYLQSSVVYAAEVKTASLVADGPYRHTRNQRPKGQQRGPGNSKRRPAARRGHLRVHA